MRTRHIKRGILARSVVVFTILLGSFAYQAVGIPNPPQNHPPLKIETTSLPDGTVGEPYLGEMQLEGGTLPWAFSATGLPKGLTFGNSDTIHGTPMEIGTFDVVVTVTDSAKPPVKVSVPYKIKIAPAH
jgi:hypothetical protein